MNFDEAFEEVVGNEGGYQDMYADRGNWTSGKIGIGVLKGTKYGIAAHSFPEEDIKNLALDRAKYLYRTHYWDQMHMEYVPKLARFSVFDMSVNSGVSTTTKLLQKTVGSKADGMIGSKTLSALVRMPAKEFYLEFTSMRLSYYISLRSFNRFGKSWVRRVAKDLKYASKKF